MARVLLNVNLASEHFYKMYSLKSTFYILLYN